MRVNDTMAKAIAAGEMDVWYQPQIASSTLRISGFEALARWNHPERGCIGPDEFLDQSEESIEDLAAFVLARACSDAALWPDLLVGVNVAPHQFAHSAFPDDIAAIAGAAGLPLDRLELEILENAALENPDAARAVMARLRAMGVRIAIDDFGQGYSRDFLMLGLPVSKIKLARSLVTDPTASDWIREFVSMAHALDMEITAEGIETKAQAQAMQAAGCDYMQGYFFARPSPGRDVVRALIGADKT
jgi:EAL domain-containing protein (putative c-di-GMP-specific phosphodiesterase class I)